MTRVLVCGGRDFTDRAFLFESLDMLDARHGPFTKVIHGAAKGADTLAQAWAVARDRAQVAYPADWSKGKSAGPRRNAEMLCERPDLVIAFEGGSGTRDLTEKARAAGFKVIEMARGLRAGRTT